MISRKSYRIFFFHQTRVVLFVYYILDQPNKIKIQKILGRIRKRREQLSMFRQCRLQKCAKKVAQQCQNHIFPNQSKTVEWLRHQDQTKFQQIGEDFHKHIRSKFTFHAIFNFKYYFIEIPALSHETYFFLMFLNYYF